MSRRPAGDNASVALFPFLAVLLCTMGSLILLLVVIARQARTQAEEAKQAAASRRTAAAEIEREREDLSWRVDQLAGSHRKTATELASLRATLAHLEEHADRLRRQAAESDAALALLESRSALDERGRDALQKELDEIRRKIAETEQKLKDAAKRGMRPQAFAIVPFDGHGATRRRPIYIECRDDAIVLQPEGIEFREKDFVGAQSADNPLASGVRAAGEYVARTTPPGDGEQAYPLLLVRPKGIAAYYAARSAMSSWDSDFGYELIDENWPLEYPPADPHLAQLLARTADAARQQQVIIARAAPSIRNTPSTATFGVARSGHGIERLDADGPPSGSSGGGRWNGGDEPDGGNVAAGGGRRGGGGLGFGDGGGRGGSATQAGGRSAGGGFPENLTAGGMNPGGAYGAGTLNGSSAGGGSPSGALAGGPQLGVPAGYGGPGGQNSAGSADARAGNGRGPGSGGEGDGEGSGNSSYRGDPGNGRGGRSTGSGQGNEAGASGTDTPSGGSGGSSATASSGGSGSGGDGSPFGGSMAGGGSASGGSSSSSVAEATMNDPNQIPTVSTVSRTETGATENVESLAKQRGADWGLHQKSRNATGLTRPIQVYCSADRLTLFSDKGVPDRQIMLEGRTAAAVDTLVEGVRQQVDAWGLAGRGMYWKPTLLMHVAPDGEGRFAELRTLLEGSGLEVTGKPISVAKPRTAAYPARR